MATARCSSRRIQGRRESAEVAAHHRTLLDFLERHGDIAGSFGSLLDCETLGRLAAASRRALALNRTGSLRFRWLAAADALDEVFAMLDANKVSREKRAFEPGPAAPSPECVRQFAEVTARDPRLEVAWPHLHLLPCSCQAKPASSGRSQVCEVSYETGKAAWRALAPTTRVPRVLAWQRDVAAVVRACPADLKYGIWEGETNWQHFLMRLGYIKCCELQRTDPYRAHWVFVNGWEHVVHSDDRKDCLFLAIVESVLQNTEYPTITKERVLDVVKDESGFDESLAPLLGTRVVRELKICRGEADLQPDWEDVLDDINCIDDLLS